MAKNDIRLEMMHPSYVELMRIINDNVDVGEEPVVNSRYTIVAACAKRARQLIDGAEPMIDDCEGMKPLTIAVHELAEGKLKILTPEEAAEAELEVQEARERALAEKEAAEAAAKAASDEESDDDEDDDESGED